MRFSTISLAVAALLVHNAVAFVPSPIEKRDWNDALSGKDGKAAIESSTAAAPSAPSAPTASPSAAAAAPVTGTNTKTSTSSSGSLDVTSTLTKLGFKNMGQNSATNNGQCWLGSDGPNTNVVTNGASEPIIVVVWGPMGSWMTGATPPLIATSLAPGSSTTISCADISGGMAAIYGSTTLSPFGQISNTWVEFTYGAWGTFDVSREVNMGGNPVSVKGGSCTSDFSNCVFVCKSGNTCMDAGSYQLLNCNAANGGGSDAAAMNGGCTVGSNAKLTTTFS